MIVALANWPSRADCGTMTLQISFLLMQDCWVRRKPPTSVIDVSVASILRMLLSSVEWIFILVALVIFYSTAECSTTGGQLLILVAGGRWA